MNKETKFSHKFVMAICYLPLVRVDFIVHTSEYSFEWIIQS